MAKGSNNLTGKRSSSHSAKPYDANNSFVKKVATKVTDFIPQRSWISKWFNMSQDNDDMLNDTEIPEETEPEEDIQKPPPSKRPRIRMDVTHPPGTFFIQPRMKPSLTKKTPSQEQYNVDNETSENFLEPASAGPSGLGGLVSSTPAAQTDIRNMAQRSELNSLVSGPANGTANGMDDNSESSESTSGCSSLIPQINRQEGPSSVTYSSPYDDRKRFMDDKMNFTNHLQSPRSLFLDNSSRDTLASRKPSFNASIMTNTLDRASPLSSPFYSGNITFGGANAAGLYKRNRSLFNNTNEYQLKTPGRRASVQVKPSNATGIDSSGMSQTAKKILEALEHFSSPISDAKKIPVKSIMNSASLLINKKRTREEAESPSSKVGLRHLTRELTVPTVPDILKLRRRQKLQDTTVAARKIVSARNGPPPPTQEYQLRSECGESSKYQGKVRGKSKTNLDEEETVETVNLPSIPLPISSLPNFNFTLPHSPNATEKTVTHEPNTFTFASPIKMTDTATNLKSVNNFTFSKPINADSKHGSMEMAGTSSSPTPMPNFIWSGSSTAPRLKERAKEGGGTPSIATADELKSGSVMDILGNKTHNKSPLNMHGKAFAAKSSQEPGLSKDGNKSSDWECSECLIRNSHSEVQCTACKASKFKPRTNQTSQSLSTSSSAVEVKPAVSDCFGSQFKLSNSQWECASCCVRNKLTELKCISCTAPKPGNTTSPESTIATAAKSSVFDLMTKFKPAEGSWECPGCMLRNPVTVITCPCCSASKPSSLKMSPKQNKDTSNTSSVANQGTTTAVTSTSAASPFAASEKTEQKSAKDFWECPSCMVRNVESVTSCPCCTTPKPSSAGSQDNNVQALSSNGFGDKFKKPQGSWCCDSCMLQNDGKTTECVACGAVKPGCNKAGPKEATSTTPQFNFGIPSSAGGFKFDAGKTEQSKTNSTPSVGGFKFDDPQQTSAAPGQFTFGIVKDGKHETSGTATAVNTSAAPSNTTTTDTESGLQANAEPEKTNMNKSSTEGEKTAAQIFSFDTAKSKEPAAVNKLFTPGLPTTATTAAPFSFGVQKVENKKVTEEKTEAPKNMFGASATNVPAVPITTNTATPVAVATTTTTTLSELSSQVGTSGNKSAPVFSFDTLNSTVLAKNNTSAAAGMTSLPASTQPSFAFTEAKAVPATTTVAAFGQIMTSTTTSAMPLTFTFVNKTADTTTSPTAAKKQAILPTASTAAPLFPTVPSSTLLFENSDTKTTPVFQTTESKSLLFTGPAPGPPKFRLPNDNKPPPAFSDAVSKPSIFGASDTKMPVFGSTEKAAPVFNAPTQPSAATPSLFGPNTTPVFGNNPPPAFGAGATSNIFSTTKSNEGSTPSANLFTFGSASTQSVQQTPSTGFNFSSNTTSGAPAQKQLFTFGSGTATSPQSNNLFGSSTFNTPAAATGGSTFTFNAPSKPAETPAFGQSTVATPIFGAPQPATQTQPAAPSGFSSMPAANTVFNFGNAAPAPAPAPGGFNFGPIASTSTPSGGFNFNPPSATPAVSFDPNAQPSFNFTGGSGLTAFNATPQQSVPRKIKKAVRRMR